MKAFIIGVDVGGTKTAVLLGTARGEIVRREQFATGAERGCLPVLAEIMASIDRVRQTSGGELLAISVSIGGPLDVLEGMILDPPHLPGWDRVPLKGILRDRFGVPVYVEHDGNAGALAEWYFGAGQGAQNIVFLTMGTGFGAGLILNGHLYRGTTDVAGEVGHIRIAEDGPACYGKRGSLEGFASGTGIALLAAEMFPALYGGGTSTAELYAQYCAGGAEAREVFARASLYLGRGFAMIADLLNPERIIMGGLGLRVHDALVAPALEIYAQEALPRARKACTVVPAALGESIGDYASLCAAFDQGKLLEIARVSPEQE
jgi:glucokinase